MFHQQAKGEMIKKLTDAMVSIEGENLRPVTWVVIEDVKSGEFESAGKHDTKRLKALASARLTITGIDSELKKRMAKP